jgi:dienelactone hydrolase
MSKIITRVLVFISFLFTLSGTTRWAYCSPEKQPDLLEGASLTGKDGFLVLHVKGSPYRMGYQHGTLLKDHIHAVFNDFFLATLKKQTRTGFKFYFFYNYFKVLSRRLERFIPQEFRQELHGIADGSGLSYDKILMEHTFLDIVSHPKYAKKGFNLCSNFAAFGQATLNGQVIHGRNLSWPSNGVPQQHAAIIFYQPDDGNAFVGLSWAGLCGVLTGMNVKGLTLGEGSVGSEESTLYGLPAFILLRQALQYSDTLYAAVGNISSQRRTTGYNILLSDAKLKTAGVLEFTAKHYTLRLPERGYVIATNHFQDPYLLETMRPVYPGRKLEDSSSYKRLESLEKLINSHYGAIDAQTARNFLSEDSLFSKSTLMSAVFLPGELKFWVASGPENIRDKKFTDFDLAQELSVPLPGKEEVNDPQEFYRYEKSPIQYSEEQLKESKLYRIFRVKYPSVIPIDCPSSNDVQLTYYEPKNKEHLPLIILLPHSAGSNSYIEGFLCRSLAEKGIACVCVDMPYQYSVKGHKWFNLQLKNGDRKQIALFFKQVVVEASRAVDWSELKANLDRDKVGIMGISLGAVVMPIVLAQDDRFKCAAYLLGGGYLSNILFKGDELLFLRKKFIEQKLTPSALQREIEIIEPLNFAYRAKRVPSFMYNTWFDLVIPRGSVAKLWRSLEEPRIYWAPAAHYTAALFMGNAQACINRFFLSTLKEEKIKKRPNLNIEAAEHVQIIAENLMKSDLKIKGSATYTGVEKSVGATLIKEHFLDSPFFAGAQVSEEQEKDARYHLRGASQGLFAGMELTEKTKATFKFDYREARVKKVSSDAPRILKDAAGTGHVSTLSFILEHSSLDNPMYPASGLQESLAWDHALKILNGDYSFTRLTAQARGYLPLSRIFTLAARTKVGLIEPTSGEEEIPYYEEFFCGGTGTVRGYRSRRVGPKDDNSLPLGGNFLLVNNLELRFPIQDKLKGALFFDAGNVWEKTGQFEIGQLRCGAGLGLRLVTKWGVGRFDYGVRLNNDKGTPKSQIHLTFGLPF